MAITKLIARVKTFGNRFLQDALNKVFQDKINELRSLANELEKIIDDYSMTAGPGDVGSSGSQIPNGFFTNLNSQTTPGSNTYFSNYYIRGTLSTDILKAYYNVGYGYIFDADSFVNELINFSFSGTIKLTWSSTAMLPAVNNAFDLGSDTYSYKSAFAYTGDFKTQVITPAIGTDTATALSVKINSTTVWSWSTSYHFLPAVTQSYNVGSGTYEINRFFGRQATLSGVTVSTNFEKFGDWAGFATYITDGTDPHTNLNGGGSALCFDPQGYYVYVNITGTQWMTVMGRRLSAPPGNKTLAQADYNRIFLSDSTSGNNTYDAPDPSAVGTDWFCTIKHTTGGNNVYFAPYSTEDVEGSASSYSIPVGEQRTFACDGTNWWVVGK